eukprot:IDg14442t1
MKPLKERLEIPKSIMYSIYCAPARDRIKTPSCTSTAIAPLLERVVIFSLCCKYGVSEWDSSENVLRRIRKAWRNSSSLNLHGPPRSIDGLDGDYLFDHSGVHRGDQVVFWGLSESSCSQIISVNSVENEWSVEVVEVAENVEHVCSLDGVSGAEEVEEATGLIYAEDVEGGANADCIRVGKIGLVESVCIREQAYATKKDCP